MLTLTIGDRDVVLTFSDGLKQQLPLDLQDLITRYFFRLPPDEGQWEAAIMTVEDAIFPVQNLLSPAENVLQIEVDGWEKLAPQQRIHRALVEQVFQQLSRYGHAQEVAVSPLAYAQFLLVREFLHHMNFDAATWLPSQKPSRKH